MDTIDNNIEIVFRCKLCKAEALSRDGIRRHLRALHHVLDELRVQDENQSSQHCVVTNASTIEVSIIIDEVPPDSSAPSRKKIEQQLPHHVGFEKGTRCDNAASAISVTRGGTRHGSSSCKSSRFADKLTDKATVCHKRIDFTYQALSVGVANRGGFDKNKTSATITPGNSNELTAPSMEEIVKEVVKSTNDLLKCTFCDYTHINHTAMKSHESTHNNLKTIKCTKCESVFWNKQALHNHYKLHHLGGEHLCDICGFRAQSKFSLFQHKLKCSTNDFKCQQCEFTTDNIVDLNEHNGTRHSNRFSCKRCTGNNKCTFETKEDILSHMEEYHPGKSCFFCDKCNFVAKLPNQLHKHYMMHTNERPSKCPKHGCRFSIRNATYLKYHITKMHSDNKFFCKRCCYVSSNQQQLDLHITAHHMKIYKCKKCDFEGKSTTALRRHCLRKHVDRSEMRFKCSKCDYCTQFRDCINKHLLTHDMSNNRHRCVLCKIIFPSREELKVHLTESHTDQAGKVRFCDKCSYSTTRSSNLSVHVSRKHSFVKPFKCSLCDYSAKCKVSMKLHNSRKHNLASATT